jgi:hypothetical protein
VEMRRLALAAWVEGLLGLGPPLAEWEPFLVFTGVREHCEQLERMQKAYLPTPPLPPLHTVVCVCVRVCVCVCDGSEGC